MKFALSLTVFSLVTGCSTLQPVVEDTSATRPKPDYFLVISAPKNGPVEKIESDLNNDPTFKALCPPLEPSIAFSPKDHKFGSKGGYRTIGYGCKSIGSDAAEENVFKFVTKKTAEYASRYPLNMIELQFFAISAHQPGVPDSDGDSHGGACVTRYCKNNPISGHPVPASQCQACPPN